MKKKFLVIILLLIISGFGFWFRYNQLALAPSGALVDEASFGYIAYSLLLTGKDEHNTPWPIVFQAFGDQKLPLYGYLSIPWIKLFGLNIFSVRLLSVIAGTLLVPVIYWLIFGIRRRHAEALLVAILTAFSPWPFILCRLALEANLTLLIFTFGFGCMLRLLNKPSLLRAGLTAIFMGLTWYGYIAFRPVTFLLTLVTTYFLIKQKASLREGIGLSFIFLLVILPWLLPTGSISNQARFKQVGLASDTGIASEINEQRSFCTLWLPKTICYANFNKMVKYADVLIARYASIISPDYMIAGGEASYLTVAGFGQVNPLLYGILILGLGAMILLGQHVLSKEQFWLTLIGLFITPVPAVLAGEVQKVRLTPWFPFMAITVAYGVILLEYWFKRWGRLRLFYWTIALVGTITFALFARFYISFTAVHAWQHGEWYQDYAMGISAFIKNVTPETLVVIQPFYGDALLFHAFYSQTDPKRYQQEIQLGEKEESGFQHAARLGNVINEPLGVKEVACMALQEGKKQALLITNDQQINLSIAYEAKSYNGVHTFAYAYNLNPNLCFSTF